MISFQGAMATFEIDESIVVSNGDPEPSEPQTVSWWAWRSHNFVGKLKAKTEDSLTFEYSPAEGDLVYYTVPDSPAYVFQRLNPTLEDLRKAARARINVGRDLEGAKGFATPYGVFDSDQASMLKINGATTGALVLASLSQPFATTWTLADNTTVDLDGPQMIEVGLAALAQVDAIYSRARVLKARIESSTDAEEIAGIVWSMTD